MKCRVINSQEVLLSKRFDGSYHNAEVNIYSSVIERHSSFKLKDYCKKKLRKECNLLKMSVG